MIKSSINENVVAIDCAAPFFFFGLELPSGRTYDKSVAEFIVEAVEAEDVPIINARDNTTVGACIGANILESGVAGRMILLPEFKDLEPKWNMMNAQFSAGLKTKGSLEGTITAESIDSLWCIIVYI